MKVSCDKIIQHLHPYLRRPLPKNISKKTTLAGDLQMDYDALDDFIAELSVIYKIHSKQSIYENEAKTAFGKFLRRFKPKYVLSIEEISIAEICEAANRGRWPEKFDYEVKKWHVA